METFVDSHKKITFVHQSVKRNPTEKERIYSHPPKDCALKTLSILIPTYNYICVELVRQLITAVQYAEKNKQPVQYEIIVGDDGSPDKQCIEKNQEINTLSNSRFIAYPTNNGRAAIRNALAREATYNYLLFIDCDAALSNNTFILKYLLEIPQNRVVCGSLLTPTPHPFHNVSLRYKYEMHATRIRTLSYRKEHPYHFFTTFNFMIQKDLFLSIGFDERCVHYGYEDALFGIQLKELGVQIKHINNPLLHLGLEPNTTFLKKTEVSLQTLYILGEDMQKHAQVSRVAQRLKDWYCIGIIKFAYKLSHKIIYKQLCGHNPSLLLFNFYKLGFYSSLKP